MGTVQAPYGSWRSPITSDEIIAKSIGLSEPRLDRSGIYWLENRPGTEPSDKPRTVIVKMDPQGKTADVFDGPFSARDTVQEYGGAPYTVSDGNVYFCNYLDEQQLYRIPVSGKPERVTSKKNMRYADLLVDPVRNQLICVRENHSATPVANEIVGISLDGRETSTVLVSGNDFYSSPRLSPDGKQLAWLTWNFPNMPWTSNQLWVAPLDVTNRLGQPQQVAGTSPESVFQPEWSPDGVLYFVSDRSDWWNLYRWFGNKVEPMAAQEAEFGQAQWFFANCTDWLRLSVESNSPRLASPQPIPYYWGYRLLIHIFSLAIF